MSSVATRVRTASSTVKIYTQTASAVWSAKPPSGAVSDGTEVR